MLINLTPHKVTICNENGDVIEEVVPSGNIPRLQEWQTEIGTEDVGLFGYRVWQVTRGGAELPEPQDGVFLIVSDMIRTAYPDRMDLLSPANTVRDDQGRVIGCTGFFTNL